MTATSSTGSRASERDELRGRAVQLAGGRSGPAEGVDDLGRLIVGGVAHSSAEVERVDVSSSRAQSTTSVCASSTRVGVWNTYRARISTVSAEASQRPLLGTSRARSTTHGCPAATEHVPTVAQAFAV